MKIRRILYPTDFSEATKVAAKYACDLADWFGAELHVLHVLHDLTSLQPYMAVTLWTKPEHIAEIVAGAERAIGEIPDAVWSNGKVVVRKVRPGDHLAHAAG